MQFYEEKKQPNKQKQKTKTKANKQTGTKTKKHDFTPSIVKNKIGLMFYSTWPSAFSFLFHITLSYLRLAKVYLGHYTMTIN